MKKSACFFVLVLLLLFGCEPNKMLVEVENSEINSLAKTTVNVPDDYPTIQDAVNDVADGTTIIIKEGVYPEIVKIFWKNDITLIGENAILCPPELDNEGNPLINGEGYFNIEVYESFNIKIMNLKFDGKIDGTTEYPIDRAIAFNGSSGEASNNKFTGYGMGIACDSRSDMVSMVISNNKFSDCYGQIGLIGNYDMRIENNKISYSFNESRFCDQWFPHWRGIEIEGGTGTISKNKIKFKGGSEYLVHEPIGIRLMKTNPAVPVGDFLDLHDMVVSKNIINGTDIGISVNDEFYPDWVVEGLSLLYNKFIKVEVDYLISNGDVSVEIKP